jgi:hypothetical protein
MVLTLSCHAGREAFFSPEAALLLAVLFAATHLCSERRRERENKEILFFFSPNAKT